MDLKEGLLKYMSENRFTSLDLLKILSMLGVIIRLHTL